MIQGIYVQGKKVDLDRARRLAEQFETEIISKLPEDKFAKYFVFDKSGITFVAGKQELKGDFTRLLPRITKGHLQHEILLKVANQGALEQVGELRGVDCTAGLGEDSFILAAGGYHMELYEHNPVTAVLLGDALIRAKSHPDLKEIAKRMTLRVGDSKELLEKLSYRPDLIYLDPMYPEKKKSGESKKKLQVLHQIETPCSDEIQLVQAAIERKPQKIIIKRPPEGPYLAGMKPNYSVKRKAVRFDCLVF